MNKPLNKRQLQHQQTLEALRKAMDELVNEIGFEKMRVKDITERVGITEGAFYHYFSSKTDLLFDRFHRANETSKEYYETVLKNLHEIDALKYCVSSSTDSIKTRVMNVLIPYYKSYVSDYTEWIKKEKDYSQFVIELIVKAGLEKGTIKPIYSAEELTHFIRIYTEGKSLMNCLTKGEYLQNEFSERVILDTLESLRA
ncbi:MAG: TetR/AcrR family transcriptional regulator [Erysipelotrichaceae bacterium]|nr:TetR/AcrR family transcriptional regulator [Erysipelotrichaceae bacterium]